MPFTLAHPAAILPIHAWSRSRLPLAALAIGSLSPDFAYFVPYALGATSHTLIGIVTVCWPAGLAAWFVFEYLLKEPTLALLPREIQVAETPQFNVALFFNVSLALMLGATTHIIWDAFTHAGSPLVAAYPGLRAILFEVFGSPVPIYKFLQHLSTIVGLTVVAIWMYIRWKTARGKMSGAVPADSRSLSRGWRIAALVVLAIASIAGALIDHHRNPSGSIERQLFYLSIGGMTGCVLAWCAVAIVVRRFRRHSASLSSERA